MGVEEELKELEQKAYLEKSEDCIAFKKILLNMVLDYSKSDIEPSELKGMVRLLANTRGWEKQYDKKINELKELKK
jgi:hypothetical protein